ncbi:hypothetical protein BDV19DRAFT_385279 [Aspergillus venezuelensis]
MNALKRPSLGQTAQIGALYDARTDTFLTESLIPTQTAIPPSAILSTSLDKIETSIIKTGNVSETLKAFQIERELGASILAETVIPKISGSGKYLSRQRDDESTVHRAAVHTVTTRAQQLNFMGGDLRNLLDLSVLQRTRATHVLTGITFGARAIVSAQRLVSAGEDRADCELILDDTLKVLYEVDQEEEEAGDEESGYNWLDLSSDNGTCEPDVGVRIRMYTDVGEALTGQSDNLADAIEHLRRLGLCVRTTGGEPLVYMLLPIAFLMTLGAVIPYSQPTGQLSPECFDRLVELMDYLACLRQTLNAHHQRIIGHRSLVSATHLSKVKDEMQKSMAAQSRLRAEFKTALQSVRDNIATSQIVVDLINSITNKILSAQDLQNLTNSCEMKLGFLSRMEELGAVYVGDADSGCSPQQVIERTATIYPTFHVFHFNGDTMDTRDSTWKQNQKFLEEILAQRPKPRVVLIDWATEQQDLKEPYITIYNNGIPVVDNLLEQKKETAGKHFVRYDCIFLEPNTDVPTYRKALRIPCPGPCCDEQDIRLWSCAECQETIEFGSRDGYFYCECGRVPFDGTEFNCQGSGHKDWYIRFERNDLCDLLRSLPPPREVNILILGETGVGKSTFVNAFVNYLTFSSLDEGLRDPKLNCIIPCSFTTQVVDDTGRMISEDIVVGKDSDEADGSKGDSATQKATVYPLYFRDTLVRLIDTPGIGDTRGLDQDKKNMANMLSILRNYQNLHGILILLKPNNARLGVMFRFCIKELLTHLHSSAAQNMVFGFTNTRGSNYTPGDTFKPLEALLSEYRNVIPPLSRPNVYCFDSESFRYLAARKNGIEMGHMEDYRRSWEHSSQEADRLLTHFRSLRPHHTQETLSLNETRYLIAQLTAPMQQISVAITDTIAKNEKQMVELNSVQGTMDDLKGKLNIHKTTVLATQLTQPKTVCANPACVETVRDEKTDSEIKLRKKLCHNPCCLRNVPVGKVGTPELVNCAAFNGPKCALCKHSWKEHEHILVEYAKRQEAAIDAAVQREITTTGSMIKTKKAAIKAIEKNIAELKDEHVAVQTAAARFSLYLKKNSITHYNDATVEYLEHLIKDEKMKVRTGQSRLRLEALEKDLDKYRKFVDTMEQGGKTGDSQKTYAQINEEGVAKLVQSLYNLPHYGQMLKDLAQVVASAYEANFRERPYRISRTKQWCHQSAAQGSSSAMYGRGQHQVPRSSFMTQTTTRQAPSPMATEFGTSSASAKKRMLGSRQGEGSSDFWPSEKQPSSSGPVRSIMDWRDAANGVESSAAGGGMMASGLSPAPPPYSEPGILGASNGSSENGSPKKGFLGRLKEKLRKK